MTDDITLRCPRCDTHREVPRCAADPASAATVFIVCLHCDDGDFHSPRFEDAQGNEVPFEVVQ